MVQQQKEMVRHFLWMIKKELMSRLNLGTIWRLRWGSQITVWVNNNSVTICGVWNDVCCDVGEGQSSACLNLHSGILERIDFSLSLSLSLQHVLNSGRGKLMPVPLCLLQNRMMTGRGWPLQALMTCEGRDKGFLCMLLDTSRVLRVRAVWVIFIWVRLIWWDRNRGEEITCI